MTRLKPGNACKRGCFWYDRLALSALAGGPRACNLELPLVVLAYGTRFGSPEFIPAGLKISGRNLVGPITSGGTNCGLTDTYVSYPGPITQVPYLEIWNAYRDGAWASSVTIEVHMLAPLLSSFVAVEVYYGDYGSGTKFSLDVGRQAALKGGTKSVVTQNCASSSLFATITVTDTGGVNIA